MLATLEHIAAGKGLVFRYGELPEENKIADKDGQFNADGYLYNEGYLNGTVRLNSDDSVIVTYQVNMWLLNDSKLYSLPAQRGPQLISMLHRLIAIYKELSAFGDVGPGTFREGVNMMDRNLDGMLMTFQFTPTVAISVC